ncbi:MAG: NAD(P)H-hydrate dehydratase [Terrimicrobiaceae bacterium]|nr:NAD(P)H-hydrate dehydratase [Terrimicrobiaceae bacterium]
MILTRAQMIEAEQSAFANGVQAVDLMELAGRRLADFVRQQSPSPGTCRVFAGKGNNGGDVLVAARHLAMAGWQIELEDVFPESALSPLPREMLSRLRACQSNPKSAGGRLVVLDGLLGIGAQGDPRQPVASAIRRISNLRRSESALVVAADIPSGLDADSGRAGSPCVQADATVTMGFAKAGLIADAAINQVGRLTVVDLDEVVPPDNADPAELLVPGLLRSLQPPRDFDTHKGRCGRIAVVAGSPGFTGAARLCSEAAVRAGGGLITLFVPPEIQPILAAACIPEVMVRSFENFDEMATDSWDVVAVGPGFGRERDAMVLEFLRTAKQPCVVDADALNALAAHSTDPLKCPPGPRLLTPHPGEMARLFPQQSRSRRAWLGDFLQTFDVTLLLKGARTIIGARGHAPRFNTTGHPGMATGGMGDVLTGTCAALIGQGQSPIDAASLGAWVCGRAAEIAIAAGASQESLAPSDILDNLGAAFSGLRSAHTL